MNRQEVLNKMLSEMESREIVISELRRTEGLIQKLILDYQDERQKIHDAYAELSAMQPEGDECKESK
jgi:hypothetical protein